MMQEKPQKTPVTNPVCKECGFMVVRFQSYLAHEDGTILCKTCFEKLRKEGKIK